MIEVENLSKRFGNLEAIKDISFSVEKGKIWGFLGPNGAGKTTTMRILTGYLPPSSGTARISGLDVTADPNRVKKKVGYLPEIVPIYPEMTVKEYLRFIAEISGIQRKKINSAVQGVVERAHLKEVYSRLVKNISKGYRQRLGIAQAIIHEPEILILDEPTIGLDPAQIIEIREMIQSFRGNTTIILSSHILPEISQVCDGAVVIKEGQLMANMTRDEWNKNLEIILTSQQGIAEQELKAKFPGIQAVKLIKNSLMITFNDIISNINPLLQYLIRQRVVIKEVKAGLEGLYMNIISTEGSQPGLSGSHQ
ncbi:MAG: ABC transporter ATP-binding protein [Candidatus Aminicenantes bacterium]|nr:ABC transporter ATP-binding protein [Candidatus Aminicenantes bacterium]